MGRRQAQAVLVATFGGRIMFFTYKPETMAQGMHREHKKVSAS